MLRKKAAAAAPTAHMNGAMVFPVIAVIIKPIMPPRKAEIIIVVGMFLLSIYTFLLIANLKNRSDRSKVTGVNIKVSRLFREKRLPRVFNAKRNANNHIRNFNSLMFNLNCNSLEYIATIKIMITFRLIEMDSNISMPE